MFKLKINEIKEMILLNDNVYINCINESLTQK